MGLVSSDTALWMPVAPDAYAHACPPSAERFCKAPLTFHINAMAFYISICLGVLTVPPAVRCIGAEKEVFWREASGRANRGAYFVGKVCVGVCVCEWRRGTQGAFNAATGPRSAPPHPLPACLPARPRAGAR